MAPPNFVDESATPYCIPAKPAHGQVSLGEETGRQTVYRTFFSLRMTLLNRVMWKIRAVAFFAGYLRVHSVVYVHMGCMLGYVVGWLVSG